MTLANPANQAAGRMGYWFLGNNRSKSWDCKGFRQCGLHFADKWIGICL